MYVMCSYVLSSPPSPHTPHTPHTPPHTNTPTHLTHPTPPPPHTQPPHARPHTTEHNITHTHTTSHHTRPLLLPEKKKDRILVIQEGADPSEAKVFGLTPHRKVRARISCVRSNCCELEQLDGHDLSGFAGAEQTHKMSKDNDAVKFGELEKNHPRRVVERSTGAEWRGEWENLCAILWR